MYTHVGPKVYKSLHWQKRNTAALDCISDIQDGELYHALSVSEGPLQEGKAISFTLNTDGIECFHSTNQSYWPALLMINELPFSAGER
jgi:hypothetical protein